MTKLRQSNKLVREKKLAQTIIFFALNMLYAVLIFPFLSLVNAEHTIPDDLNWNEISTRNLTQPQGRFDAQVWVDNQKQIWLYGGKSVIRIHGSDVIQHLCDLWKFDPRLHHWYKIAHQNSSKQPKINRGFSCFCQGQAFVFGHQIEKKFPELWAYNITSNFWSLVPHNIKNTENCFAMWCSLDSDVSLLCYGNTNAVKLWIFKITSGNWSSKILTDKINFTDTSNRNVSSHFSIWNNPYGLVCIYIWSNSNIRKKSVLLFVGHHGISITKVNNTKQEYSSNRKGFMRWIDSHGNLHLLGGGVSYITTHSASHFMLNMSDYSWSTVNSKHVNQPSSRVRACFWQVDGNLWLFGGFKRNGKGRMVVFNDFWIGNSSKYTVPRQTPVNHQLPGDTLGLSLVNKLIISFVTLIVVIAISVRLCYKRELNLLMSRLQKNRVVYHQLSQEGDKSTRL